MDRLKSALKDVLLAMTFGVGYAADAWFIHWPLMIVGFVLLDRWYEQRA